MIQEECLQKEREDVNEENEGLKTLVSKKKEQHRVEIRKKQNQAKFRQNRLQISEMSDIQRFKDFADRDNLDINSLNINTSIDGFVSAYKQNNFELIKFEVMCIRMCISLEHKLGELEYSNSVIYEKGILHYLFSYLTLQYDEEYELQRDALWIIAHFLSQQNLRHILYVVENVPATTFFRLVETGKHSIKLNALLSIYNIMDENEVGAKKLIDSDIITFMCRLVHEFLPNDTGLLERTILIIRDLFAFSLNETISIPLEQLMPLIDATLPLFQYVNDNQESADNLFEAILRITERDDEDIDQFYSSCNGIVLKTLQYIREHSKLSSAYLIPPLRIIHNLSNSYDHITESLVQFGLLDMLSQLVKHRDTKVKKLIISTISNLCASGKTVIDYLMEHRVIIFDIINAIENSDFMLKMEATIAFCHILMTIGIKQIEEFMTDYDGIKILIDQIKYVDVNLNMKIIKALINVINVGERIKNKKNYFYNIYTKKFNQYGGREKVATLAESQNEQLKNISEQLLAITYIIDADVEEEMEQQYIEDNQDFHCEDADEGEEQDPQ